MIDKQGQYVSVGDFAIIMEGKNKGKLGKVMHISNATVFLHSRDNVEHGGIFVAKSNTLQLAGYKSQQDLTELSRGMISRDSTVGGKAHISMKRSGAMNLNKRPEREKKDLDIGKTMQITQGNWRMIGIVVDGTNIQNVELHSKNKTVTVLKSRCRGNERPFRENSGKEYRHDDDSRNRLYWVSRFEYSKYDSRFVHPWYVWCRRDYSRDARRRSGWSYPNAWGHNTYECG